MSGARLAGLAGPDRQRFFKQKGASSPSGLRKFEDLGLLVSRREGSARVYYFTRSPVVDALRTFLRSALERLPESTVQKHYRERRRPRRFAKR